MTLDELSEAFEKCDDGEFLEFERVENKLSARPDLHAFLLLEQLVPGKGDMVSAAEHDQIWLDVDPSTLAEVITAEQVRDLARCGVMYDSDQECFSLFA